MLPLDVVVKGASECMQQQQQQRLRAVGAQSAVAAVHKPQIVTHGLAFPLEAGLAR